MTIQTLDIQGMTCAACVRAVERAVSRLPGVSSVAVNLATEKARITAEAEVPLDSLQKAVKDAGYRALPAASGGDRQRTKERNYRQQGIQLAVAAVFTVARLVQRKPLTQALAGIVGVGLSAWLANSTGKAEDFYVLGFFTNLGYILAMAISIAVRWPFAGLLFGFIRNEGLDWRKHPARVKSYRIGTWVIISVLALRLIVQVPLYLMGEQGLAGLATTRLIMGAPLYILGMWVAWLLTRPAPAPVGEPVAEPAGD